MRSRLLLAGALGTVIAALLYLPITDAQFTDEQPHVGGWQTLKSFTTPAVSLGVLRSFSVLAYTTVANSGDTILAGDIGVSPGATMSGFPPGIVEGATHLNDSTAQQAQVDFSAAYNQILAMKGGIPFMGDLNGTTFTPGLYRTSAAFTLTGNLTFDAQNNPNSNFIFQVAAAWNTAASSTMTLKNGALASHIFFQVAGAAGTGALSSSTGVVLAAGAITAGDGSSIQGRLFSQGTVTLARNHVGL